MTSNEKCSKSIHTVPSLIQHTSPTKAVANSEILHVHCHNHTIPNNAANLPPLPLPLPCVLAPSAPSVPGASLALAALALALPLPLPLPVPLPLPLPLALPLAFALHMNGEKWFSKQVD